MNDEEKAYLELKKDLKKDGFNIKKLKEKEGYYQIITRYAGIIFNEVEWCCPFDNYVLFNNGIWIGHINLCENDFFDILYEKRERRLKEVENDE